MKNKRLLKVLIVTILITMLTGTIAPATCIAAVSITVLNPLGEIETVYNQPLAERLSDLDGKSIALVYYAKALSPQSMRAIGNLLKSKYPELSVTEYNIGSEIGAKPLGNYETLSSHDAVVLGIADCTLSAWWGAYHAKMIEALGTPVVLLIHESFEESNIAGGLDNGFTGARRALLDRSIYSRALTVLRNTDVDYLEDAFSEPTARYPTVLDQIEAALTNNLTPVEKNPPAITPRQLAGWTSGDPTLPTLTINAVDEVRAAQKFNSMAMELGFGDGLPLIMPLPELVEEMLEATTRNRNDVLGKIMPRGGIVTVEKVAINSVMAGARPEYFPAILAAVEAYATSWEDANLLYHTLTSSDNYSLMLLFSGPIVEELGISGQWGFLSSGNEANNAIGRAVRLSIRNIGLNRTHVTDGTARQGRQNDHALTVFGEEARLLPEGWERHHELMGFDRDQSTVTLLGYYAPNMYFAMGGVNAEFVPLEVIASAASAAGKNNISIMTIPRNVAALLQSGLGPTGEKILSKKELVTEYMGYSGDSQYLIWPIVVGDPESARVYTGGPGQFGMAPPRFYGMQAFQTRVITGSTKTVSGQNPAPPGAPTNVKLSYGGGKAIISWDAPPGGDTGLRYQVSYTGGAAGGMANPKGVLPKTVIPVPPAPPAESLEFARPPELAAAFEIGVWPRDPGTYDPALDGQGIIPGTIIYGLFDSSFNPLPPPGSVTGYTEAENPGAMVPGSYFILYGSSGFNYVLVMPEAKGSVPLTYDPAPLDNSHENFPAWIDVPAGMKSITIIGVEPNDPYYNNFWVRAVDDNIKNAVTVAEKIVEPGENGISTTEIVLDTSASGRGAWAKAMVSEEPQPPLPPWPGGGKYPLPPPDTDDLDLPPAEQDGPPTDEDVGPFKDVSENDWFHEAVMYVYEKGLMQGTSADRFSPNQFLTRGMIVTILYRLEGSPDVFSLENPFSDLDENTWYADAVKWAETNNIVTGYGDGTFGADNRISREQMAAILYRYANFKGYDVSSQADISAFADWQEVADYALVPMSWANAHGLITGRTVNTLAPKGHTTRAEAATILMRYLENIAE